MSEVSAFVEKLREIVDREDLRDIVAWSDDGTAFLVIDAERFERSVLRHYFKSAHMSSFMRNLSYYGFKKHLSKRAVIFSPAHPDAAVFSHPHFLRDHPDRMGRIRRKSPNEPDVVQDETATLRSELLSAQRSMRDLRSRLSRAQAEVQSLRANETRLQTELARARAELEGWKQHKAQNGNGGKGGRLAPTFVNRGAEGGEGGGEVLMMMGPSRKRPRSTVESAGGVSTDTDLLSGMGYGHAPRVNRGPSHSSLLSGGSALAALDADVDGETADAMAQLAIEQMGGEWWNNEEVVFEEGGAGGMMHSQALVPPQDETRQFPSSQQYDDDDDDDDQEDGEALPMTPSHAAPDSGYRLSSLQSQDAALSPSMILGGVVADRSGQQRASAEEVADVQRAFGAANDDVKADVLAQAVRQAGGGAEALRRACMDAAELVLEPSLPMEMDDLADPSSSPSSNGRTLYSARTAAKELRSVLSSRGPEFLLQCLMPLKECTTILRNIGLGLGAAAITAAAAAAAASATASVARAAGLLLTAGIARTNSAASAASSVHEHQRATRAKI